MIGHHLAREFLDAPDRAPEATELLRRHGALEVRNER